jgi:TATA-box binding protein (TBP) (component of TFIID and TFIIIB)
MNIRVVTASATHQLEETVRIRNIPFKFTYEPEIFPGVRFRREGLHFALHFSDVLIITGIKSPKDVNEVVFPVVLELDVSL